MTMAIPESDGKIGSSSKSKSKLETKKKTWAENKRDLVKKRIMDLSQTLNNHKNQEQSNKPASSIRASDVPGNAIVAVNHSADVLTPAMERAQEVQDNLPLGSPSCLKRMLPSHVSGGYWLSLPRQFCNQHMPDTDDNIVLVDENGNEHRVVYLANKNGLSGGWRGFSIHHKLVADDVLIFQRIGRLKLKVYIIRASRLTELDGAIGLLNMDVGAKPMDTASDVDSEMDITFAKHVLDFKDVKKFEDFEINVDGVIIDSEIPKHVRERYYELCCSQNMFLHEHVTGGFNIKLVCGMISETVNIADAVRLVKSTTPVNHIEIWYKTLKAFEDLGLSVGFMSVRMHKLLSLVAESKAAIESKRGEKEEAEKEMTCLEEKLCGVRATLKKLDVEILALVAEDKDCDSVLKEIACASW